MISFCFLLFTLLSTINVVNFHLSVFFYILKMILTWILALNFSKMVLKWNFFTWTMSILSKIFEKPLMNIIQNIWETLDFFLHLFHRNSKTSQKSIVFSFFLPFCDSNFGPKSTHIFIFCVFMNMSWTKSDKTNRNSCFCLKSDLFWVWKWAIMDHAHF